MKCFVYGILFNPSYSPLRLILSPGHYSHFTGEEAEDHCVYMAHPRWAQLVSSRVQVETQSSPTLSF